MRNEISQKHCKAVFLNTGGAALLSLGREPTVPVVDPGRRRGEFRHVVTEPEPW